MLYGLILTLLIIDGLLLAVVILLQAGQGGGLASLGGGTTDLVMGGRQAVTLLHTLAWWTGGIFMFLALVLSMMSSGRNIGESEVQRALRAQPAATAPVPAPIGEAPATNAAPITPAPAPATPPATN